MHHTWGVCGHQAPGRLSYLDLGRTQNTGLTESVPLWSTQEPEHELIRHGGARKPGPTLDSSLAEQPRA